MLITFPVYLPIYFLFHNCLFLKLGLGSLISKSLKNNLSSSDAFGNGARPLFGEAGWGGAASEGRVTSQLPQVILL